jgi:hypothetical protein
LGVSVITTGLSSNWSLDVTVDDPTGFYPNPTLNPGQPATAAPGQMGGRVVSILSASGFGGPGPSSSNWYGVLTGPIAAWRITNNSTAGTVTATVLQPGPR